MRILLNVVRTAGFCNFLCHLHSLQQQHNYYTNLQHEVHHIHRVVQQSAHQKNVNISWYMYVSMYVYFLYLQQCQKRSHGPMNMGQKWYIFEVITIWRLGDSYIYVNSFLNVTNHGTAQVIVFTNVLHKFKIDITAIQKIR